jgi:hypothetical protein
METESIRERFFQYQIDPAHERATERTRKLIEEEVGSYAKLKGYSRTPE